MAETNAAANPSKSRKSAAPKASASKAGNTGGRSDANPGATSTAGSKARFAKAIEEARAGAEALRTEAQERAGAYREQLAGRSGEWLDEARTIGEQARTRAADLAVEGKSRATGAISSLSKIVADNAGTIEEKFGAQYADYARKAAASMQDAAERLDAKSIDELGEDAREFVRKSPGLAVGLAAAAGFMLARTFKKSDD